MLTRIFDSPIMDIIIIILIIRFVFPNLFSFKVYRFNQQNNQHQYKQNQEADVIIKQKKQVPNTDKLGEYIDYEEVKDEK